MRDFLSYYKWHLIVTVAVLLCGFFIYIGASQKDPDLNIAFVSSTHMNTQYFEDAKGELELLLKDANHDSSRLAKVKAFTQKASNDSLAKLEECINSGEYDAYISDKQTFEKMKDKSVFEDASNFLPEDIAVEQLKDENGRIYALSLKDNSLAKRLGIFENKDSFIAVGVKLVDGERSAAMKNAMNISRYIVKSKDKYNNY